MISDEIQTNLIKKRIHFIDDSLTADAIKEMEKGMSGMMDPDSAIPMGQLKSPNLYLTGDIRDNVRTVNGRQIQYLVVTLKLYNLKTQVVEWQDQQEFLKSTKKDKVSF
jgi:PBP1b-binding outer membrane lipoprotein LpoB